MLFQLRASILASVPLSARKNTRISALQQSCGRKKAAIKGHLITCSVYLTIPAYRFYDILFITPLRFRVTSKLEFKLKIYL